MPRRPPPKPVPMHSSPLGEGILSAITVEVWANRADAGGRGAHSKRQHDHALNLVLDDLSRRYLQENVSRSIQTNALRTLLGHRTVAAIVKEYVEPVLKKNKVVLGKTALWKVAQEVSKTFRALEAAVKSNPSNIEKLERWSPEHSVGEELAKGTFRRKL